MLTDVRAAAMATAWGEYVPGRRIEVEPCDLTHQSVSGAGPCADEARVRPERWLTQRAVESPHPLTWHSPAFDSLTDARHEQYRMENVVPHLSSVVADVHWSIFGCDGDKNEAGKTRSVVDCRHKECVTYSRTLLKAIAEDAAIVLELLEQTSS